MNYIRTENLYVKNSVSGDFWKCSFYDDGTHLMQIKLFGMYFSQVKGKAIYIYDAQFEQDFDAGSQLSDIEYKAINEIFNRAWNEFNHILKYGKKY